MFKTLASVVAVMVLIGSPALATSHDSGGELVKIHTSAGKITMKHGPIKKLELDSMAMVFRVSDPAMLDAVKAGDRVRFEADRVITILKIDKAK